MFKYGDRIEYIYKGLADTKYVHTGTVTRVEGNRLWALWDDNQSFEQHAPIEECTLLFKKPRRTLPEWF